MSLFWTPAREGHLAALVAQKLTAEQIGVQLGCSRKAVTTKVKRGGGRFGRLERSNRPNAGATGFWTPERERRLVDLVARGLSAQQIASILGCTRHAVAGKVWRAKGRLGRLAREPGWNSCAPRPARRVAALDRQVARRTVSRSARPAATESLPCEAAPESLVVAPPAEPIAFVDAVERELCLWFACDASAPDGPDMPVCGGARADAPRTRYCAYHLGMAGRRDAA